VFDIAVLVVVIGLFLRDMMMGEVDQLHVVVSVVVLVENYEEDDET